MEVFSIRKNELLINDEIMDKEIRVIDADGSMLGVMMLKDAQDLSASKDLDLVKIVPNAVPPVCKVMDYKKYMFEKSKKDKEIKKIQKNVSFKEVRVSAKIEEHDFNFKVKSAYKFLQDGHNVKVSIKFRGREMRYTLTGKEVMKKFADAVMDVGSVDKQPKLEGRSMIMILNPKNNKENKS